MIISSNTTESVPSKKSDDISVGTDAVSVSKPRKQIIKERDISILNDQSQETETLRPTKMTQYVGQAKMMKQLSLIINSAKMRDKMPEHILFYGPPGLGKTTAAGLIADELGSNLKILAAPSLQKVGDVVSLLLSLEPKTVLFIDEIHRLRAPLEEVLYTAMEDGKVDLIMGKGNGSSVARLDLNEFVLVGATTQLGKLSKPLKDRFPSIFQLEPYSNVEMEKLIIRSSEILKISVSAEVNNMVCLRSRGTPRIANNILKRLLDYQVVHGVDTISESEAEGFFHDLGILEKGLTKADIRYMRAISESTIGLQTLAGMLLEEVETIELAIEPYLLHLGFLDKSSGGRSLTQKGRDFLMTTQIA
jgi:holliday junction DNA helicase RuvB